MNRRDVYDDPRWDALRERVLERDAKRCVLAWLIGGPCSETLHVHHVLTIDERPDLAFEETNLVTACENHHPMLEALRRAVLEFSRRRAARRCPHVHRTRLGREACEQQLNAA